MTPVLEVQNVTLRFGGLVALNKVSFSVKPGEIVGVIGPNGAGKTTLFDVITGVYRPREGPIILGGERITSWRPYRRARAGLARSFQTVGLAGGLTGRENLLAAIEALDGVRVPYPRRRTAAERRRRANELLQHFGLEAEADRQANLLPFGTAKLLELAKVFAGTPRVVLLDEPFAGLSTPEALGRVELARQRGVDAGTALVIVEHDLPLMQETCARVLVLDYGNLIADGPPQEVMEKAEVKSAYLGETVQDVHA
jgi:branched-chain amino acid transport system ATP-binding protein